jgi:4-hydroxy-4-methyl-2-oxoglutarate aldolase
VVDGRLWEVPFIRKLNFPVFTDFYMPASSNSRCELKEFHGVIKVGEVSVHPGDYVLDDLDGVVVIPRALTEEVLAEAEKAVRREAKMRQALRRGMPLQEVNKKFGAF